jgi:hypothetical protein
MKYELHPICAREMTPADLVADIKAFFVAAQSGAKAEEMGDAVKPRKNDALAYLATRGLGDVADVSGKHPTVRWTTSDGRERPMTLPKKPYGSANAQSLARLRRALEGASQ